MKKTTWITVIVILIILSGIVFVAKENIHITKDMPVSITEATSTTPMPATSTQPRATSTPPTTPKVHSYGEVKVRVGETVTFPLSSLKLVRVFEDSRCPVDVTCVWAGTIKAEVIYSTSLGVTVTKIIELNKVESVEKGSIRIVAVTPSPKQGTTLSQKDYVVTFEVKVIKEPIIYID